MNRRRKTYLRNAAALSVSGLALRAIGMLFRVFVAAALGAEGMGLYQLILAFYMVPVSFATAGVQVASTALAAKSLARGRGMAATKRGLVGTALLFGTASMVGQGALAVPVSTLLLHDVRAELPLLILAPSLPFMAVAAALRGCFLAARQVKPNIVAQFVEQAVRMAVAAAALQTMAAWGAGWGCVAVMLGNTVSEGVSCLLMLQFALRAPGFHPRRPSSADTAFPYTKRELYGILWPVTGSRLLASALQAIESSLIPTCLALYTGSRAEALAQYGGLKGMALPLLFFPFSILSALSGLLMPEITRAHTAGNMAETRRLTLTMLKVTGAFSLLAGAAFVLLGQPLALLLYGDAAVGRQVRVLGFVAPFMYLESMVDGVLKGMGEQLATFRYSLADSALRIAAVCLLLPHYGMAGFLAIMIASNLFTFALNTHRMLTVTIKPEK